MNTNEMRNLTREISEKRTCHDVKCQENEKKMAIEMAKKVVDAKKALYGRQIKSQKKGSSHAFNLWMWRGLLATGAAVFISILMFLCAGIFQRKPAEIAGEDRDSLSKFAEDVILDYEKGAGGKLKTKWCYGASRQIMEKGCGRMESFSKAGKPEIQEMAYDARTSCYLIRYVNQSDESLTMKVARIRKGGLVLVGIQ